MSRVFCLEGNVWVIISWWVMFEFPPIYIVGASPTFESPPIHYLNYQKLSLFYFLFNIIDLILPQQHNKYVTISIGPMLLLYNVVFFVDNSQFCVMLFNVLCKSLNRM
jgi:hypothetical protein